MRVGKCSLLIAAALTVAWSSVANAILIPTNFGKGADAEVRESQFTSPDFAGSFTGINRGNNGELATRLSTNQSSIMYMKFDISTLPASSDTFWDDKDVVIALEMFARQSGNFSLFPEGTNAAMEPTDLTFSVYTLDPNGTYAAARTDRVGNNYTATYNQYDWVEGTGDQTGISFYDAPGIQPFCMNANMCGDDGSGGQIPFDSTRGVYDDFDSNAQYIGDYIPELDYPGVANLTVGDPLTIDLPGIKAAVFAALDAGQDTVTFMFHHKGPQADTVQQALGRNYLVAPKEHLSLGGVLDNSNGAYSPTLRIQVPEPASLVMLGLGCLGLLVARRRG